MNQPSEYHSKPADQEADTMALLKRMQQQLEYLEKKIDLLLKQSSEKPFREDRPRPSFRHGGGHGHPRRHGLDDRPRSHSSGPRDFGNRRSERSFDKPHGKSHQGFDPRGPRPFSRHRDRH